MILIQASLKPMTSLSILKCNKTYKTSTSLPHNSTLLEKIKNLTLTRVFLALLKPSFALRFPTPTNAAIKINK